MRVRRLNTELLLFVLLIAGFLIHSFTIKLGINLKFWQVAILFSAMMILIKQKNIFSFTKYDKSIIIFVILFMISMLISSINSIYDIDSIKFFIYLFMIIFFSLLFIFCSSRFIDNFNRYLKVYIVVISIAFLGYLYVYIFVDINTFIGDFKQIDSRKDLVNSVYAFVFPEYGGLFMRFNGYNLDPNFWGVYALVSFWLLVLFKTISEKRDKEFSSKLYKIALVLSIFSIILTFSRGTYLSFLLSVGLYVVLSLRVKNIVYLATTILVIVLTLISLYFSIDEFKYAVDLKLFNSAVETDNPRIEKWIFYTDHIYNSNVFRILFGFGLIDLFDWHYGTTMHNTYIQIFASVGLLGFGVLIGFILFSILVILSKYIAKITSIQIALLSSVVASVFFVDMLYSPALWIGIIIPFYTQKLLQGHNYAK